MGLHKDNCKRKIKKPSRSFLKNFGIAIKRRNKKPIKIEPLYPFVCIYMPSARITSASRATTTAEMQGISSASWNITRTMVKTCRSFN